MVLIGASRMAYREQERVHASFCTPMSFGHARHPGDMPCSHVPALLFLTPCRLRGDDGDRVRGGALGLGLLMGGAVFSYGRQRGCRKAEILAIDDDSECVRDLGNRCINRERVRERSWQWMTRGSEGLCDSALPPSMWCRSRSWMS
jgi:hypothetical protein